MTTPSPDRPVPTPHDTVAPDLAAVEAEEESQGTWGGPGGGRGDAGRPRRLWWWAGGLAVAAMSALAVWFGISATTGHVNWVDTGHEIVSDSRVDVRFDLRRDPARAVVCRLEAQDISHTVVGRTEVEVGPAPASPSRHVLPVETATRAVTGYVDTCWYADEAPPTQR
ncbi:DUF4307 domain-containing protein [Ornithinimicrobium tianjinense]|uniref:DUF4307 domain-containing protein n=1 Tax=Ornithinimicrobium tianjinense TaxID=1195761 RepID=A0A917BHA9_9MICO|nr:DUF4307 domain-containing protein [Ornithinimicrobium tianjinense]GGF39075.1 hypothetical protein GCM10011366_03350 [Ornithinimicrobium tianjinense]